MPGFAVGQNFGGMAGMRTATATQEYLYTYTWEIFELFETQEPLLVHAKELTTPTFSVGIEMQQGASLEYKFAKSVSYDDVKVTFYDTVGLIRILKGWRQRVWTAAEGLKLAERYKRNSRLLIYPPTWEEDKATNWKLIGSWPSVIRHGELTYTSSDVKIVEVTVTYDWAEEEQGWEGTGPDLAINYGNPTAPPGINPAGLV
jgi:hypothetical protein